MCKKERAFYISLIIFISSVVFCAGLVTGAVLHEKDYVKRVKLVERICLEIDPGINKHYGLYKDVTYCRVEDTETEITKDSYEKMITSFLCDVDPHCETKWSIRGRYKITCGGVVREDN